MEHRWGDRVRCDAVVRLLADPASVAWGRIRDISITGAFIETKLALRPLSTLHIARTSDRRGERALEVGAIVVRNEPDGVGIEWFDSGSQEVLAMIEAARASSRPWPAQRHGRDNPRVSERLG